MKTQFIILSLVLLCSCNKLKDDHDFLHGEWIEVNSNQPASIIFFRNKISFKNIHNRITSKKIKSIKSRLSESNKYVYQIKYVNNDTKSFFSNLHKDTLFFHLDGTVQINQNLFAGRTFVKKVGS
jgi:hypothetical protein